MGTWSKDHPIEHREYQKLYYQKHKEAILKRQKKNRNTNRPVIHNKKYQSDYRKRWRKDNPEKHSLQQRLRQSRQRAAGGFVTLQEWFLLCFAVGFLCLCCKKVVGFLKLTPDHVVPVSKGGSGWLWNIQPLCLTCNQCKGSNTIDYRK